MKKTIMFFVIILVSIVNVMGQASSTNQNGLQSTVTNVLAANATQAKRFEVASVLYNSVHWQNSSIIQVELFNVYHNSGYEKFTIELGFGQGTGVTTPKIVHTDSKGINNNAKVVLGTPVNHTTTHSGKINKILPIYVDVRHYSQYRVKITHLKEKVTAFTASGQIIINESPVGVNINDFTPLPYARIIHKKGVVGIGTNSPGEGISPLADLKLHVNGSITVQPGNKIAVDHNYYSHGYIAYNNSVPKARFLRYGYYGHRFDDNGGTRMVIQQGGNVGIGTTDPKGYKLAVNGTIHSKEVKVDLVGWPDYVFTKEYQLPTLEEVENHIKEKGHLVNIPSAEEVEKNGVRLGEMNKKLLEKIEELTLYTIEQEKKIKKQEKENKELKDRLTKIEELLKSIKK